MPRFFLLDLYNIFKYVMDLYRKPELLTFYCRVDFFQLDFIIFAAQTVIVAQLVRASDCGSEGRRFEPG